MLKLWCAGIIGTCNEDTAGKERFHPLTCLYCRFRRKFYGKYTEPPYYICYTYKNYWYEHVVPFVDDGNLRYTLSNGGNLRHTIYFTLKIDPRGKFTALRCATIIVIDNLLKHIRRKSRRPEWNFDASSFRPWVEICEFLTNYP